MKENQYFSAETFKFLKGLKKHNNKDWFLANKGNFQLHVQDPLSRFISDLSPQLDKISANFIADPRPNGRSIFRIYRDIRFSHDKSPYKTNIGSHFPHRDAAKG